MQLHDDELDRRPNQAALLKHLGGPEPAPAVPGAVAPGFAPGEPTPGGMPEAPPVELPSAPGPFQSQNKSLSGYLQEAAASFRPELIKQQGDAARKSSAEGFIKSLIPEMQARGWQGGEIKNEKYQDGGRWYDLYQDVDGIANPQHLDVTDDGSGQQMGSAGGRAVGSAMGGLNGLLQGDPTQRIQSVLQQYSEPSKNLEALLAQLGVQR